MNKLILTDVDDVLVDWGVQFTNYVNALGYNPSVPLSHFYFIDKWLGITREEADLLVHEFNTSDYFSSLPAFSDAEEFVPKLHNMGYEFIAITAVPNHSEMWYRRLANLQLRFPGVFKTLIHTGIDKPHPKLEYLSKYPSSFWVEDNYKNAVDGADAGHTSFLISKPYNEKMTDDRLIRVTGWTDIYNFIISA